MKEKLSEADEIIFKSSKNLDRHIAISYWLLQSGLTYSEAITFCRTQADYLEAKRKEFENE